MGIQRNTENTGVVETKDYLDESGRFLFGKYSGELAETVAVKDHSYVQWLVTNRDDMSDEDREVLSAYLTYAERKM